MAKKYYAVYYGDGKGKIFTRLKAFQSATAKKSAKLYRGSVSSWKQNCG